MLLLKINNTILEAYGTKKFFNKRKFQRNAKGKKRLNGNPGRGFSPWYRLRGKIERRILAKMDIEIDYPVTKPIAVKFRSKAINSL